VGGGCKITEACLPGLVCVDSKCAAVLGLGAVSGDSGTNDNTDGSAGLADFAVSATQPAVFARTGSTDIAFTITRSGGFTGAVTLALATPPSGVSAPSLTTTGANLNVTVSTVSAPCGPLPLSFTASATALTNKSVIVSSDVGLPNDIALSLDNASVVMLAGGSAVVQGNVTRGDCAPQDTAVAGSSGLPSGVTVVLGSSESPSFSFSAGLGASVGTTSAMLKVTVGGKVIAQPIDVTIVQSVSGKGIGTAGFPAIARVEVAGPSPAPCVVTGADGSFTLSSASLKSPYALRVSAVSEAETCTNEKLDTITYVDLTTLSPTLTVLTVFGTTDQPDYDLHVDDLPGDCSASEHDALPTATDNLALSIGGAQDFNLSYAADGTNWLDVIGGSFAAPNFTWFGPNTSRPAKLHYLRYTIDAGGQPNVYTGHRVVDLGQLSSTSPPTCLAAWGTDAITSRAPLTITRTGPLLTATNPISLANAELPDGAFFSLVKRTNVFTSVPTSVVLPNIPVTVGVREFYRSADAVSALAITGANPSGTLALVFTALPTLTHTGPGCTGNTYCWSAPANTLRIASISNTSTGCSCSVVSTRSSYAFSTNECVSSCLAPSTWSVTAISTFGSSDEAVTPAGYFTEFAGVFGGLNGTPYLFTPIKRNKVLSQFTGVP